jgi:prepilin-type processing-associated H-X9-DG protein
MALVVFLAGVALPGIFGNSKETSRRVKCAQNLKMLGQALLLYANENNGNYPRTVWSPDSDKLAFYSKPDAKNPFAKGDDGVDPADVTAAMFLLARTQDITTEVFICPSSDAESLTGKDKDGKDKVYNVQEHSNFPGVKNLSYSMHVPYPTNAARNDGFRWTNTLSADFATVADMNPGTEELTKLTALSPAKDLRKGNSLNHGGDGQNVLYGDGHVDFIQTPFAGIDQENIYTYGPSGKTKGGDGIVGRPMSKNDSILLPTAAKDDKVKG